MGVSEATSVLGSVRDFPSVRGFQFSPFRMRDTSPNFGESVHLSNNDSLGGIQSVKILSWPATTFFVDRSAETLKSFRNESTPDAWTSAYRTETCFPRSLWPLA